MMPRKGMLLSAGLGTRMRPLTDTLPKPLIPVSGMTLIDRALDWFATGGVTDVVVNTHYKAEMIASHVRSRTRPKVHISYEEIVLETGGGIKKALPFFEGEPFFSANSDVVILDGRESALARLWQAWDDKKMDALLLLHPVANAVGYEGKGDFFYDGVHLSRRLDRPAAPYVFTGAQLLHPRLFNGAPEGPFSLNILYNRCITTEGILPRIGAIVHEGEWLHVGDPQGLVKAEEKISALA